MMGWFIEPRDSGGRNASVAERYAIEGAMLGPPKGIHHGIAVREMTEADHAMWTEMPTALWPEATCERAEDVFIALSDPDCWGFIAETPTGEPAGFAEMSIRKFANGCESAPVPFLEGIWIAPQFRQQGAAARLIAHIEAFVHARGFTEMGSDALLENRI